MPKVPEEFEEPEVFKVPEVSEVSEKSKVGLTRPSCPKYPRVAE